MILETDSTLDEPQLTPQPSLPGDLEAEAPSSAQPGIWSQRLRDGQRLFPEALS